MNEACFFIGGEVFAVELGDEITLRTQVGFTPIWCFYRSNHRGKKQTRQPLKLPGLKMRPLEPGLLDHDLATGAAAAGCGELLAGA
jgi:hypothetical protein